MKANFKLMAVAYVVVALISTVITKGDWKKIGELSKGGSAGIGNEVSAVKLISIDDIATINTLIIKVDGKWQKNKGTQLLTKMKAKNLASLKLKQMRSV